MVRVHEVRAKSVIRKTGIPGADWGINYYSGCTHGCIYCYLRFLCKWRREEWGEFVDVKINAPELVAKESRDKKGTAILCTGGDAYQPIDKIYQLTRRVLQNLNPDLRLSILTKSDLITRDIDLFKRFKNVELGLTITTLSERVRKLFEPFASSSHARIEALRRLKQEGFFTYVFVGPILPYLTDLEEIFRRVSPFVDLLMFEDLNMNPARKRIMDVIRNNFPELEDKYLKLSSEFWLEKEKEIKALAERFNKPIKIYFKHTGSLKFK